MGTMLAASEMNVFDMATRPVKCHAMLQFFHGQTPIEKDRFILLHEQLACSVWL